MGCLAILAARLVLSFVMAACGEGEAEPPTAARVSRLGESFTLRVGEAVRVEDADVTVTFKEVASDSRCPKDVTCIQAGEAVVHLAVVSEAGEKAVLELGVPPGGSSMAASFQAFRITIFELNPQKESGKPIDPATYVATVRVNRA